MADFRNSKSSTPHTNLVLNIAPIRIDAEEVTVGIFPYESHEQLRKLRDQYRATHFLRRENYHGSDEIVAVGLGADSPCIGSSSRKIKLSEHLYLCAALVRDALITFLHKWNRPTPEYDPIHILTDNNLLQGLIPGVECPGWLSVRSRYQMTARVINLYKSEPFVGLVLDVETANLIDASCAELLERDFPLEELYVGSYCDQPDSRLAPKFRLAGRVCSILGDELVLTDHRDDFGTIEREKAYLDPSPTAFRRCMSHVYGERLSEAEQALRDRLAEERGGPTRLQRLMETLGKLGGKTINMAPAATFTIGQFLSQDADGRFPKVRKAPSPVYVFDSNRTANWNDAGLKAHGPYSRRFFTPARPRICVVCQKSRRGNVEQFLYKFREGIPGNPKYKSQPPFEQGFLRKYHLSDVSFEFYEADDNSPGAYARAARQAIQTATQEGFAWDVAFVQIESIFHEFRGDDNPYLVTKSMFLTQQIPVQAFQIEKTRKRDYDLSFILNTMGLATYAKMRGIPWLIQTDMSIAHEFVIGLGSAAIGEGKLGKRERIVGITTVLKGDGTYMLSNLSPGVPMDGYQEVLLSSLRLTIERVRQEQNWQPREAVRLIFHAFKPMKNIEADAVKNLMSELGDYDVQFAFLHVIDNHPYVLFDRNQVGAEDRETGLLKGEYAPTRGIYFPLTDSESLITLVGHRQLKQPSDGMPRPVLLRLHPASTFTDMDYLARQAYTFSCHSWKSFEHAPMPVTILYSDLVAEFLGKLSRVTKWNPDAMLGKIGTTRWFL